MTCEELALAILNDPPMELFREMAAEVPFPTEHARAAVLAEVEAAEPSDRIALWAMLVGGAA